MIKRVIQQEGHTHSIKALSEKYDFSLYRAEKIFKELIAQKRLERTKLMGELADKYVTNNFKNRNIERKCLSCSSTFLASSKYIRMCEACKRKAKEIF